MPGMTRSGVRSRFQARVDASEPLVLGGAGIGLVAKAADRAGIDALMAYNTGPFRMDGHGSLAGYLAYGDSNAMTIELARQILPVAREYRELLKKAGMQETVSFIGLEVFINAKVLVEGLRRAGKDPTRPRFIQALESLRQFDVGGFEVNFGKGVRQGSRFVDLTIIGAGGKFTR